MSTSSCELTWPNTKISLGSATHQVLIETLIAKRHGDPVPRVPAEPVDRAARYWEEIEQREAN